MALSILNKTEKAFSLNGHEKYDMPDKFFKSHYFILVITSMSPGHFDQRGKLNN